MRVALIALILACGGTPAPTKSSAPPPLDAKTLARQIDGDMAQLAALAKQHRGDCRALTRAIEPLVDTMQVHAREAETMAADPAQARVLRTEMDGYARAAGARVDAIANDLGASFRACASADEAHRLERQIARIPTY